ncbi:hypothetical protein BKA56DRAFT_614609 [Ilyonectria sp. MPI-CAGE-AT-0026]|nr:hypothetical protein BKA56DRAFT_614609 [Ilyonectria sp. MPI-CAGE-AT-0026]
MALGFLPRSLLSSPFTTPALAVRPPVSMPIMAGSPSPTLVALVLHLSGPFGEPAWSVWAAWPGAAIGCGPRPVGGAREQRRGDGASGLITRWLLLRLAIDDPDVVVVVVVVDAFWVNLGKITHPPAVAPVRIRILGPIRGHSGVLRSERAPVC